MKTLLREPKKLVERPPVISKERWRLTDELAREKLARAVKEGRYCPEITGMRGLIVEKSSCTETITVHELESRHCLGSDDLRPQVGISIGASMADPEKFL